MVVQLETTFPSLPSICLRVIMQVLAKVTGGDPKGAQFLHHLLIPCVDFLLPSCN